MFSTVYNTLKNMCADSNICKYDLQELSDKTNIRPKKLEAFLYRYMTKTWDVFEQDKEKYIYLRPLGH